MKEKKGQSHVISTIFLILLAFIFIAPIILVLLNSFKANNKVSGPEFFALPLGDLFVGLDNYIKGFEQPIVSAFGYSAFITVVSVIIIIVFTSMTAWFITRVKTKFTSFVYFLFVFSMIVPFQMVMFTMSHMANNWYLNTPYTIPFVYWGFGAGLATFMFCGFVKSIPLDIEEAAMIDGCTPLRTYFSVVFPILKPTIITVAILQTMWIWNDYLLPYLILDSDHATVPIVIQRLKGSYGSIDWGAMMALLVLAMIPIIIFYACCQKYIIKGVMAGAVKG